MLQLLLIKVPNQRIILLIEHMTRPSPFIPLRSAKEALLEDESTRFPIGYSIKPSSENDSFDTKLNKM